MAVQCTYMYMYMYMYSYSTPLCQDQATKLTHFSAAPERERQNPCRSGTPVETTVVLIFLSGENLLHLHCIYIYIVHTIHVMYYNIRTYVHVRKYIYTHVLLSMVLDSLVSLFSLSLSPSLPPSLPLSLSLSPSSLSTSLSKSPR